MAWRPGSYVMKGELDNTTFGWTLGWIQLEGRNDPLQLKLSGNCHPDLAGWKFRICRTDDCGVRDPAVDVNDADTDQSGMIGDVTADKLRRHLEVPAEKYLQQIAEGIAPPAIWRKALYLEWFSNRNGRVVIESTELGLERIGEKAFELTEEQYFEQVRRNEKEMEFFMEQVADAMGNRLQSGEGNDASEEH